MLLFVAVLCVALYCAHTTHTLTTRQHRFQRKSEWVAQEIIRLKAFMPHQGCRKVSQAFNRLFAHSHEMTISKSTAHNIISKNKYAIYLLQKTFKKRTPSTLPKNITWAMDLTTITDSQKHQHTVLGIIDRGTRANVLLERIANKSSITLLRHLLDMIEYYGKPKVLRSDNEAVFKSRLLRYILWLLRIKPQYTEIACPRCSNNFHIKFVCFSG
jgi:putative transposase